MTVKHVKLRCASWNTDGSLNFTFGFVSGEEDVIQWEAPAWMTYDLVARSIAALCVNNKDRGLEVIEELDAVRPRASCTSVADVKRAFAPATIVPGQWFKELHALTEGAAHDLDAALNGNPDLAGPRFAKALKKVTESQRRIRRLMESAEAKA